MGAAFRVRNPAATMSPKFTRRQFVASTAGWLFLPSARARAAHTYQANERLNVAVVGMAGYGAYHGFAESIHAYDNVTYAVSCDVDLRKVRRVHELWDERAREWPHATDTARKAAASHYVRLARHRPPFYKDYRRMLDEAADSIDAVVVATPDHTHAVITAAALRAGKPVLTEKPLTISAHEARALHHLSKSRRLPTQMNTGGTASHGFRRGVEILREGILGEVTEVHAFFSRGGRHFVDPPAGPVATPAELDWDLWLAQVAWRDYHPGWINRIAWRDTSLGELGNFGPHTMNMAFLSLNVKDLWHMPEQAGTIRVSAECSDVNQLSYPRWERIHWELPARGPLPPVHFTWHHGYPPDYSPGSRQSLARRLQDHGASDADLKSLLPNAGCLILGNRGLLATNSHNTSFHLLPDHRFAEVERGRPVQLPASPGHYREWIDACRGGTMPLANFDYAAPFAEFLAVGSIATRFPGETLEFDPGTGRITNHARAAGLIEYPYREGWTL
jgi:hypothetical protein